jgi:hypothetical protein
LEPLVLHPPAAGFWLRQFKKPISKKNLQPSSKPVNGYFRKLPIFKITATVRNKKIKEKNKGSQQSTMKGDHLLSLSNVEPLNIFFTPPLPMTSFLPLAFALFVS